MYPSKRLHKSQAAVEMSLGVDSDMNTATNMNSTITTLYLPQNLMGSID